MPELTTNDLSMLPAALREPVRTAFERLLDNADEALRTRLDTLLDTGTRAQLAAVLATSEYVGEQLRRQPTLLAELLDCGDLERQPCLDDYREVLAHALADVDSEEALGQALRRLRRREMVRIVWRDFTGTADFAATTAALSALAESCLDAALDWLYHRLCADLGTPTGAESGQPQRLVVLGMGKLGAGELNLSSDIDLIFAFDEDGETVGGRRTLDNQQFFLRLGQRLIRALDTITGDGFVFRVDMRLRPYGDSGALALSFDAMEEYYLDQGRPWERYAMIKARVVAGDFDAGERLQALLRPFVYRRYVDFRAVESLREMKALINREVARRGLEEDVKLGGGGIREIEFIGQVFQLIRGGRDVVLQERRLLTVLAILGDEGSLPAPAVAELTDAYIFLRNTEHAIQGIRDQQTQSLPTDDLDRARVAFVMGFADWAAFRAALDEHRRCVRSHFDAVIAPPDDEAGGDNGRDPGWQALWLGELEADRAETWLAEQGYEDAGESARLLGALRESKRVQYMQTEGRERLDAFMPLILAEATLAEQPSRLLNRLLPLVDAVLRRTAYLVLLLENPAARHQLCILCDASPFIADQLAHHPALLDELVNAATLYKVPDRQALRDELRQQVLRLEPADLEGQMEALRYFRLAHLLRVAASEVAGEVPLMKISDYLTWVAEVILGHVLAVAWQNLTSRNGLPQKADGGEVADFIIVGYGKLGGIELGHGSDLDLVFVYDGDPNAATDGERPIAGQLFFTRLGQRIIHILTTATPLGTLYEVDMRLRPSGNSGMLVSSLAAFERYQRSEAWTWEHQALVRARVVAGSEGLARRFEALRRDLLGQPRDSERLREDVRAMRQRMREHLLPKEAADESPNFHLKQGSGGIVDIEFMVQFAVLAWAHEHPALTRYSDNIRILETLSECGLLTADDVAGLIDAYKAYRAASHRLALQREPAIVASETFAVHRSQVLTVWRRLIGDSMGDGPATAPDS